MKTTEILKALPTLSIEDRLNIATSALDSIDLQADMTTEKQVEQQLRIAADLAVDDYANDRELTIFTSLDGEDFLE
ncbi:hypothetical protein [Chamaesiphon sp. GL140_3_metabinner_50]|uniref:hypothetical protein n=1 Tax=Chamaesiphon sp. GL140_3_metabinner_50 TaxID=2970812 RepID=UPI0025FEB9CD|nr:hypothetical protein [Chamaesiphon sp. GL140_3_metabinner_50]